MTTTLIYEPIAYISDDYFYSPKSGDSLNSRDFALLVSATICQRYLEMLDDSSCLP
jgi:hypothetical protein